ncbi:receptor protein kinase-like protein ZAR1 [Wolffia australiana]
MAGARRRSLLFLSALFVCLAAPLPSSGLTTDGLSLLALKTAISADPTQSLSSWAGSDRTPCYWAGVTCRRGRVVAVSLSGLSLSGYLPSELALLTSLQNLSLSHNNLSGFIPAQIGALTALVSLDLSFNSLSGAIPSEVGSLQELVHLDLSSNYLSGSLPPSIGNLPNLAGVLNLSCNRISGGIPAAYGSLPVAVSLDLQQNNLSGGIPQTGSLLNQGPTAFSGNPLLCGFPLKNPCQVSDGTLSGPVQNPILTPFSAETETKKKWSPAAVPVLVGVIAAAVVFVVLLHWLCRRRRGGGKEKPSKEKKVEEKREGQSGELFVPVDEGFGLELEELLRASAYVVGKSRTGIVYKVVVGRGSVVAVRRLSEGDDGAAGGDGGWRRRRDFEAEVAGISRVKHPNVVGLRAYYYAPDEKLLVYDYIPNGSLHGALHGGAASAPLPWAARLKIVQGAARGLAFIHECSSPRRFVHGNIKSSKILLDEDLNAFVSGFGLARLASSQTRKLSSSSVQLVSSGVAQKLPGSPSSSYLAPEARAGGGGSTQKGDVYAFGVVLMEALTGRPPGAAAELDGEELEVFVRRAFKEERALSEIVDSALLHEVHAKKQVLAVFHVALGCTEPDPDSRPRMRAVSQSLDRLGGPP